MIRACKSGSYQGLDSTLSHPRKCGDRLPKETAQRAVDQDLDKQYYSR